MLQRNVYKSIIYIIDILIIANMTTIFADNIIIITRQRFSRNIKNFSRTRTLQETLALKLEHLNK